MKKVELMLFDLDGTLIDSSSDLARSINLMLADLGRPELEEAVVGSFVGDGVPVLVHRSLTATHPDRLPPDPETHSKGISLMLGHYSGQMLVSTKLYPYVPETLEHFAGKRKAIVTSKEVRFTREILERLGIDSHFDCIVGGDTVTARKPDPEPVLEAVRLLRVESGSAHAMDDVVMVGDSENDVLSGRRAGAITCAVSYGFRTAEQLAPYAPDVLIDGFEGLTGEFH